MGGVRDTARADLLVTADHLQREITQRPGALHLLDVRWRLDQPDGLPDYLQGHLPGAVFVDLPTQLADPHAPDIQGRHPLPSPEQFQEATRRWGLSAGAEVVVYDDAGSTAAARAWWLLRAAGLSQVRILDGGIGAWHAAGYPLESGAVTPSPGTLTVESAGAADALSSDDAAGWPERGLLIDARAAHRYRGEHEPLDPRAGHIPGAVNLPATSLIDDAGAFLPTDRLRSVLRDAGVDGERPVAVYCGSGVTASHAIFAMALTGQDSRLYPGSFSQWSRDPQRPVSASTPPAIYVLHDNPEWMPPFLSAFSAQGVDVEEWLLPGTVLDLSSPPPPGVFYSRLSASSHTRTDPHVKDYGRAVLAWLQDAGATVINGAAVYEVEVSKIRQHRALERAGFTTPRTVAAFGHQGIPEAASSFTPPFITKHNQGGKGLGVRRFDSHEQLAAAAEDFAPGGENAPIDGITLIQDYVVPAEPFITRAEFIGGRFHYAVAVDISSGSFELCPADTCEVPAQTADVPAFRLRPEITAETPLVVKLEALLATLGVEIAGIEFIETHDGDQVVYDINTNTNYNPAVESQIADSGGTPAAHAVARYVGSRR